MIQYRQPIYEASTDGSPVYLDPPHVVERIREREEKYGRERLRRVVYVSRHLEFLEAIGDWIDLPDEILMRVDEEGSASGSKAIVAGRLLTRNILERFYQQLLEAEARHIKDGAAVTAEEKKEWRAMVERHWKVEEAGERAGWIVEP